MQTVVTNEQLFSNFQANHDEESFTRLYNSCSNRMRSIAKSITADSHAAEDIVQDTFGKLAQESDSFGNVESFGALANTIVSRAALNHVRDSVQPVSIWNIDKEDTDDVIPAVQVERQEMAERVNALIDRMSWPDQYILRAYFFEKKTIEKIADHTDTPYDTIKLRLRNAMLHFRGMWKE